MATWTWFEPNGTPHSLDNPGLVRATLGRQGEGMPPMELLEDIVPLQPGARIRHVSVKPRDLQFPLLIEGSSFADLEANWRQVMRWFDPRWGDGRLRRTGDDGNDRELVCRYARGGELVRDQSVGLHAFQIVLVLRASDPFWYDAADQSAAFSLAAQTGSFFPIFPVSLGASTVFGESAIENDADETWPRFVIQGPGEDPIITNTTTGRRLALTRHLSASEALTVDTRPGIKSIVDQTGVSQFPSLASGSALWQLIPGTNQIRIELPSATEDSSVVMFWRRRWLGG